MLFGPVWLEKGQHLELCAANLGEGDINAFVHFRNLTTKEVTTPESVTITTGSGQCVTYRNSSGRVIAMARGDGRASDWVSPSNALISTLTVRDNGGSTVAVVLGVPKIWLRGL
jgi:hypothetical protein